jgi:hypothetical protein
VERIDVAGLTIAFERTGQGTPVVLLHGGLSDNPSGGDRLTRCATTLPSSPGMPLLRALIGSARGLPSARLRRLPRMHMDTAQMLAALESSTVTHA